MQISRYAKFLFLAMLLPCISGHADTAHKLTPTAGEEIGMVFEAFLSPQQEPGEEEDTPDSVAEEFRSTAPSLTRAERVANGHRGHAIVRFTKDLSKAYIDVAIEGIRIEDINMFHIHCGKPGILGPILVDFALVTDIRKNFADDRVFSVQVTNDAIVQTAKQGEESIEAAFSRGCVIPSLDLAALSQLFNGEVVPPTKVSTISGMAAIAQEGEIYFNLHTVGQTYFGDIRGQWYPVMDNQSSTQR